MAGIALSVERAEGRVVIKMAGDLDVVTCGRLATLAAEEVVDGDRVILDLAGLTFLDSSGLGVIVTLWKRLNRTGGDLVLAGPRYAGARALWITGVIDRLPVAESVAAALAGELRER